MSYIATVPETHPDAFAKNSDTVRCSDCGPLPEPCAECRSLAQAMSDMSSEGGI